MVEFPGFFVVAGALAGASGMVLFYGSAVIADYSITFIPEANPGSKAIVETRQKRQIRARFRRK